MAVSITVVKVKTDYLNADFNATKYDDMITAYINGVVKGAVDYIDDPNYTAQSNLPSNLEFYLCRQIAYVFRQRKTLGLSSVSMGEGSTSKYEIKEWLPDVRAALDRIITITI